MFEKYNYLFGIYLCICKGEYDPEEPEEKDMKECIKRCERFEEKLLGMIDLMREAGILDNEAVEKERDRIMDTFSSITIYNAYMDDGEVMVFVNRN